MDDERTDEQRAMDEHLGGVADAVGLVPTTIEEPDSEHLFDQGGDLVVDEHGHLVISDEPPPAPPEPA